MSICPFCHSNVTQNDDVVVCPSCNTMHHKDCWNHNHGCGVFECQKNPNTWHDKRLDSVIVKGKRDQIAEVQVPIVNSTLIPIFFSVLVLSVLCIGGGALLVGSVSVGSSPDPVWTSQSTVVPTVVTLIPIEMPNFLIGSTDYPWLEANALESYTREERERVGVYTYTIQNLSQKTTLLWNYGWCTSTAELLNQNWEYISLNFIYDDTYLPLDQFGLVETVEHFDSLNEDLYCRSYYAALTDWPTGQHKLSTIITFITPINDGIMDYEAGTRTYEYFVDVNP